MRLLATIHRIAREYDLVHGHGRARRDLVTFAAWLPALFAIAAGLAAATGRL